MADAKLTVGDLMEGALALVSKRPLTVGAFVLLYLVASYGTTYVAYNLGFAFLGAPA